MISDAFRWTAGVARKWTNVTWRSLSKYRGHAIQTRSRFPPGGHRPHLWLHRSAPVRCRSAHRLHRCAASAFFLQAPPQQFPDARRYIRRQQRPIRLALQHSGQNLRNIFTFERRLVRSAFRTARSRTRRCRCGGPPSCLSPVPATCRLPFPESLRHSSPPCSSVGEFDRAAFAGSFSNAFASPKSSTFTLPSGVIFTFAGFRSRWMIPFSCAASSASQICFAIPSDSSTGIGPRLIRSASVSPSTSSITRNLRSPDSSSP